MACQVLSKRKLVTHDKKLERDWAASLRQGSFALETMALKAIEATETVGFTGILIGFRGI